MSSDKLFVAVRTIGKRTSHVEPLGSLSVVFYEALRFRSVRKTER